MSTRSSVGFGVVEHAAAETPINSDESRAGREQAAALRRLQKILAACPQPDTCSENIFNHGWTRINTDEKMDFSRVNQSTNQ